VPWKPVPSAAPPAPKTAAAAIPPDLADRIRRLTLVDVIDLALRNNASTKASWADARAAAAAYAVSRNAYLPSATAEGSVTRLKTAATSGRSAVLQTVYGPSVSLSFLLFDLGGRSGDAIAAREALFAADWTHNATIQNVVLQAEQGFFRYMSQKSLVEAQRATLEDTEANLRAADERHRLGLATIADVLQSRTAASRARLALETTQGDLQSTRGALAAAMGLPPNLPYDVEAAPDTLPAPRVQDSVDTLITQALRSRPDLAAAWAQARAARGRARSVRARGLPSITVEGNAGETYVNRRPKGSESYSGSVSLQVPLVPFLTGRDDAAEASAQADAAAARAEALGQQVVSQAFASYYALDTAAQRVETSRDLMASARASEDVALARYRAGAGSVLDLLQAQSALADARAQEIDARWGWYSALAQLAHDTGVLGVRGEAPFRFGSIDTTGGSR